MRFGKKAASVAAALAIIAVQMPSTQAMTLSLKPSWHSAAKIEVRNYRGYRRHARRNTGPVYGRGYMNCINSGHPADFCQAVSRDFRGSR